MVYRRRAPAVPTVRERQPIKGLPLQTVQAEVIARLEQRGIGVEFCTDTKSSFIILRIGNISTVDTIIEARKVFNVVLAECLAERRNRPIKDD